MELPVVVGAGPVGLAAAAELVEHGQRTLVLEKADRAGAAVAEWAHVRLFSQWSEPVDPAAGRLLAGTGWPAEYPTGAEWVARYLRPLAEALGDRVVDDGRDTEPLTVHLRSGERIAARAVIDASGTCDSPNPLGGDGLPAAGEHDADRIPTASRTSPTAPAGTWSSPAVGTRR